MTTNHADLIRRLRNRSATQPENFGLDDEAADALEAMQADAARWRTFLATRPESTHETICAAIDAARGQE